MTVYGSGVLKGLGVTFRHFIATFVDDIKYLGKKNNLEVFQQRQSLDAKGMYTVEYPDEKLAVPERFRYIPFLVTYNNDDPEFPGRDWCTTCGICAKVCPPQCIWIEQGKNPETGRPKPEPEAFYIDIDICMNCGYCAEYCPFDAIKMDHDYELASYDRTSNHVFDLPKLSKEIRYWQMIAPTTAAEEEAARGGYDHKDVQKLRKKEGLPPSRPGPTTDKPVQAAAAVVVPVVPAVPVVSAPIAAAPAAVSSAAPGGTTTADGKVIVRRGQRAAKPSTPSDVAAGTSPVIQAPPTPAEVPTGTQSGLLPSTAAAAASVPDPLPAPTPGDVGLTAGTPTASTDEVDANGMVRRGKRIIDPNAKPTVVRRRGSGG